MKKNRDYMVSKTRTRPTVRTRTALQWTGEEEDDMFPEGLGGKEG